MASNYQVLSQTQSVKINPAGTGFDDVWEITYKVTAGPSMGTVATVAVPDSQHTADMVQAAIESKIATLDEVASLGKGKSA